MELHQNVEKLLHLREKVVENSRLAPQFLPSQRPNLPAITDSPEGGANLLVTAVTYSGKEWLFMEGARGKIIRYADSVKEERGFMHFPGFLLILWKV